MPKKNERDCVSYYRDGSLPGFQEPENDSAWPFDHGAEGTCMDEKGYGGHVLYVEAHVSDNRRRDLDGILATVCDCITAIGRQLEGDSDENHSRKKSSQR